LLAGEIIGDGDSIVLQNIQSLLFVAGCELATELDGEPFHKLQASNIEMLEKEIDRIDSALPKLSDFVIPGGSRQAAIAHICRTVCRRAERRICELNEREPVDNLLLEFVNRLSDYFFVLARKLCLVEKGDFFLHNACI